MQDMAKVKRNPAAEAIASKILSEYNPESVEDMQNALRDIFGPMFEGLLKGELNHHLGYESNSKEEKTTANRRNGTTPKTLKTTMGPVGINSPRDRDGSFEPQIIPKRMKDVSAIEGKVLSMYARGMSQRDISKTIEEIYGFEVSHQMISDITDTILPEVEEWRNRPLKRCYPFLFVDCMYVTVRSEYESKEEAVYVILGYDLEGHKEVLGLWMDVSESKNYWMQVFDEIKKRGVEDVFFISMDGVSGLEDGARAIFPGVIVQRWIRNSIKYIPSKDYKKFTADLKKIYGAPSLNAARKSFETFCDTWKQYPGAIDVWKRNFKHVEQLFDYGSSVRSVMHTTNVIESVNSSLRKVTKRGSFPNQQAVFKLLYLRIRELDQKWNGAAKQNWSLVLNQLMVNELFTDRINRYLKY